MASVKFLRAQLSPFGVDVSAAGGTVDDVAETVGLDTLFQREGLVVLRGLSMSPQEQIRLCRHIGPVQDSPFENFLVSNVDESGHLGARELLWHNDVAYLPAPYLGASLHALAVEPGTTGTRFASGYRAWEKLPATLKERVAHLKALQVRERVWHRSNRLTDLEAGDICTVHPVVRRQPGSGRPYLFVNEDMTACIIGLSEADSDNLLAELFAYLYAPDNVYEHHWSTGDCVIWDNLALQHARGQVGQGVRTLQRVTIAELGYEAQYPTDTGIYTSLSNQGIGA